MAQHSEAFSMQKKGMKSKGTHERRSSINQGNTSCNQNSSESLPIRRLNPKLTNNPKPSNAEHCEEWKIWKQLEIKHSAGNAKEHSHLANSQSVLCGVIHVLTNALGNGQLSVTSLPITAQTAHNSNSTRLVNQSIVTQLGCPQNRASGSNKNGVTTDVCNKHGHVLEALGRRLKAVLRLRLNGQAVCVQKGKQFSSFSGTVDGENGPESRPFSRVTEGYRNILCLEYAIVDYTLLSKYMQMYFTKKGQILSYASKPDFRKNQSLSLFLIVVKYMEHKIYNFEHRTGSSVALKIFILLYGHNIRPSPGLSHLPKLRPCAYQTSPLLSCQLPAAIVYFPPLNSTVRT